MLRRYLTKDECFFLQSPDTDKGGFPISIMARPLNAWLNDKCERGVIQSSCVQLIVAVRTPEYFLLPKNRDCRHLHALEPFSTSPPVIGYFHATAFSHGLPRWYLITSLHLRLSIPHRMFQSTCPEASNLQTGRHQPNPIDRSPETYFQYGEFCTEYGVNHTVYGYNCNRWGNQRIFSTSKPGLAS